MSRLIPGLVAIALGVSLLSAPAAMPAAEPAATFTTAAVATTYADPHWYPLRMDAELRCYFTIEKDGGACQGSQPKYAALDLASAVDKGGEPVHASGKGIFHVGGTVRNRCETDLTKSTRGNWAWVDHGGGVVSKYQHLDTMRSDLEGKVVDPTTVIGTMGQSGSLCGPTFYLHYETRRGGVNGTPFAPTLLRICKPAKTVYPTALGYSSWDDMKWGTEVEGGTDGCYTDPITADRPSAVYQARGNTWARVRWPAAPAGTREIAVHRQEYQVAAGKWGLDTYRYRGGKATYTDYTDVRSMRKYRARVAYRNANGYSVWTGWRYLVGPPRVPAFREISATSSRVIYRWYKPLHNGLEVDSYTAAIRPKVNGTWRKWSYKKVPVTTTSADWTGLSSGRTYAVKVRANAGSFSSAYNSVKTITTK